MKTFNKQPCSVIAKPYIDPTDPTWIIKSKRSRWTVKSKIDIEELFIGESATYVLDPLGRRIRWGQGA